MLFTLDNAFEIINADIYPTLTNVTRTYCKVFNLVGLAPRLIPLAEDLLY